MAPRERSALLVHAGGVAARIGAVAAISTIMAVGGSQRAEAHIVGIAEQVLQPVGALHALLPLLATAILLRQQPGFRLTRVVALALAAGLGCGLLPRVLAAPKLNEALALCVAIATGAIAAAGRPLPPWGLVVAVIALGFGLGCNLLSETGDALDLAMSLGGAFAGTLIALELAGAVVRPKPESLQGIGERIGASWVVAIAAMLVALSARGLT